MKVKCNVEQNVSQKKKFLKFLKNQVDDEFLIEF